MMKIIKKKKDSLNSWINKLLYGVTLSIFIITLCFIGIIVALYFFVMFISQELLDFVKEVPTYQATLATVGGISLAYIFKKFK